jgi:hypothetical protein
MPLNIDQKYADLEAVNVQFNADLQRHIDGTLPINHIYQLGYPEAILLSAGVEYLPIELNTARLSLKASKDYHSCHPFDISAIKNLPIAVNRPIAVFSDAHISDGRIILTELVYNADNFFVAVRKRKDKNHRKIVVETNSIRTIYPKNQLHGIMGCFNSKENLLRWEDKEKALRFISIQSPNRIADGNKGRAINNAINKINDFQNPFYP